jgi:hypothetical protein
VEGEDFEAHYEVQALPHLAYMLIIGGNGNRAVEII